MLTILGLLELVYLRMSGIVVGRLQHDGILPLSHCNHLKRRFEWVSDDKES